MLFITKQITLLQTGIMSMSYTLFSIEETKHKIKFLLHDYLWYVQKPYSFIINGTHINLLSVLLPTFSGK